MKAYISASSGGPEQDDMHHFRLILNHFRWRFHDFLASCQHQRQKHLLSAKRHSNKKSFKILSNFRYCQQSWSLPLDSSDDHELLALCQSHIYFHSFQFVSWIIFVLERRSFYIRHKDALQRAKLTKK